jgi:uncharacterized protein YjiS (DUF1127 family)
LAWVYASAASVAFAGDRAVRRAQDAVMPGRPHENIMVRPRLPSPTFLHPPKRASRRRERSRFGFAQAGPRRLAAAALARAVVAVVLAWRRRAGQRDDLRRLTDRQLDDIGLTRAEAEREAAKPFWRD